MTGETDKDYSKFKLNAFIICSFIIYSFIHGIIFNWNVIII